MIKVYVLGGSGFVGTSLLNKIKDDSKIDAFCADIKESQITNKNLKVDVEDYESLNLISDADVIINLAAVHRDDIKPISKYDDVNVDGARNICNIARENGINNIIFTSSVAIYGFAPPNTGENGEANYFNDYGRTKYLAEAVFKEWYEEDANNRNLTIIRPTVIFGKGNRGNVYNLLKQVASKKFIMFGNGKNIKSMAYVENVTAFINFCLNNQKGLKIYNYIDKPDLNMNDLLSISRNILFKKNNVSIRLPYYLGILIGYFADFINFFLQNNLPISSIRVKKFLSTTQFDSSVHNTEFIPPYSLKKALEETIEYEFVNDNSDKPTFFTE